MGLEEVRERAASRRREATRRRRRGGRGSGGVERGGKARRLRDQRRLQQQRRQQKERIEEPRQRAARQISEVFDSELQRQTAAGQASVLRNTAAAALRAQPLVQNNLVNEAARAAQAQRVGVAPPGEGPQFGQFRAGGSIAAQQNAALIQRYQQTGITPPQNLLDAQNQRVAPPYFGGFPGIPEGALQVGDPRERIVQRREEGRFQGREFYQGGSEQATLGPVAQAEAFFHGTSGERWQLGGYYRGINPEDRLPPTHISPLSYRILTQGIESEFNVPPEFIERLYDLDPVTGFWVRKTGSEDLPIDAGYGGYGYGFPGYGYPGYGGGGGSYTPRAPSMGLVNWRI